MPYGKPPRPKFKAPYHQSRSALPACFDSKLNLCKKRGRDQDSTSVVTSESWNSGARVGQPSLHVHKDDAFLNERTKRLRACSPSDGNSSKTGLQHDVAHLCASSPQSPQLHHQQQHQQHQQHQQQLHQQNDSKKRGRSNDTSPTRKPSLFYRAWEAYPSAREKQQRRDGNADQNLHFGRRHNKSARTHHHHATTTLPQSSSSSSQWDGTGSGFDR